MSQTLNPIDQQNVPVAMPAVASRGADWTHLTFQFGVLSLIVSSLWLMLGSDPSTTFDFSVRVGLFALSSSVSLLTWLASAPVKTVRRLVVSVIIIGVILAGSTRAVMRFDRTLHVLEPGVLSNGRIVHRSLGFSYPRLPHSQVNLTPKFTRKSESRRDDATLDHRLRFGEVAFLSRMTYAQLPQEPVRPPWFILIEIQRDTTADLNEFIMNIRNNERHWAAVPNVRILRPTHSLRIGSLDLVEFDFVEEPQGLVSRQVYLKTGSLILNFMLNSEVSSDNRLFDEFLNGIRLE